ncbi:MAG: N-acetylneuraminate synthase [Rhodocyclaceae bacterium]|nr:N-acetylneuraminate synthase [Rhodocyclaceae bacterium]
MSKRVFVIAEAGVNHNGSLDLALELIDAAAVAGADAVKFQTFKSEAVISRFAIKADYQIRTTGKEESQLDMVKKLELGLAAHLKMLERCAQHGIQFLSTPFDLESVDLLVDHLHVSMLKIPSGEITNAPLILRIARTGKPVILSTGMSTLAEIEQALGVLAFGYLSCESKPSLEGFSEVYFSEAGQRILKEKVWLLHCTTEYPAPFADVNLHAMETMRNAFGLPVGYSDHTEGFVVPIAAVALGAGIIEKHFTLNRNLPGPDHKASLEPMELAQMVAAIRQVEEALGKSAKIPAPSELKNKPIARKSLVASVPVRCGEIFSECNLTAKRPGTGISPMRYWEYIGKPTQRDYAEDEAI